MKAPRKVDTLQGQPGARHPAEQKCIAQLTLDASDDGLLLTRTDGAIVDVNAMSCRMLGRTREELLSMTVADVDVKFQMEEWLARIESLRARKRLRGETIHRAKDGRTYPVEFTTSLILSENREYVCCFSRDISERKRSEEDLRRDAAALRTLFHAAPVGVATLKERRILDVNEAFCSMFGWTRDTLIGQSTRCIYASDEVFEDVGRRAYPDVHSAPAIECLGRRSNGELFPLLVKGASSNGVNADDGIILTATDISQLRRSENELRRSNRQLRMLIDCNQALFRATNEVELLQLVCSVIVEEGGYALAWVGYVEDGGARRIRLVTQAGPGESYLDDLSASGEDREGSSNLAWEVLNTLSPRAVQITDEHLVSQSLRARAQKHGYQAVCGLPLLGDGNAFGVLFIYSSTPGSFDQKELALLTELAGDLAFGLCGLRAREERDNVHRLLTESEERFSKAFQLSPAALVISEIDSGKLVYVNAAAEEKLERPRCELIGRTAMELGIWPDRSMRDRVIHAIKAHGEAKDLPIQIVSKSGRIREAIYSGVPITIGGHTLMLSLVVDVTENRLAERALQESEERYRRLVATVPDMIVLTDLDGTIRLVNEEGFVKRHVIPNLSMVGRNILDFIAPEDRDRADRNTKRRLQQSLGPQEYRLLLGKDHCLDCEINGEVLRDAQRMPIGMVYVIRDISDRKHAEEVLRTSEKRFREVAANSGEFIWEIDIAGLYTYASPIAEAMFGYTPEELVGKIHFYDLYPAELRDGLKDQRVGSLTGGSDRQSSIDEKVRKDGTRILTQTSVVPIVDDSGNVVGVRGSSIDVTQQIRAQEQLKQSLHEKEIMLKEIHHRVKNNMQVISSLLSLESQRLTDPHVRELFGESMNRIRTMALVHEKLYRSGSLAAIEFDEFLTSVASDLQRYYSVHGVACKVEAEHLSLAIDTAIPCGLIANELVSNALKHAFTGRSSGNVLIRLRRLEEGVLELTVADDGVGFPSTVDFRKLTSMGMTLITALSAQIDGTMRMERNGGTQFILTIPGH
jgi:PAS domain S-box-containing protein